MTISFSRTLRRTKIIVQYMRFSQRCGCIYWCSLWFILIPWRWKQEVSPKRWCLYTNVLDMTLVGWCFEQLGVSSLCTLNKQELLPLEINILQHEADERYAGYKTPLTVCLPGPSSDTLLSCARFSQCVTFILVCITFRRLSHPHNRHIVSAVVTWGRRHSRDCIMKMQPVICIPLGRTGHDKLSTVIISSYFVVMCFSAEGKCRADRNWTR